MYLCTIDVQSKYTKSPGDDDDHHHQLHVKPRIWRHKKESLFVHLLLHLLEKKTATTTTATKKSRIYITCNLCIVLFVNSYCCVLYICVSKRVRLSVCAQQYNNND